MMCIKGSQREGQGWGFSLCFKEFDDKLKNNVQGEEKFFPNSFGLSEILRNFAAE